MSTIYFSVTDSAMTPAVPQFAGVQGDHNATTVVFALPPSWIEAGYAVRAEFVDGAGAFDTTPFLEIADSAVSVPLPLAWTAAGGLAEIRLAAAQILGVGQPERMVAYSPVGYLYFESRAGEPEELREFPDRGLSALIADCMASSDAAVTAAATAESAAAQLLLRADAGEFDGSRGEKGKQGEKGERGERGYGLVMYDTLYEDEEGLSVSEGVELDDYEAALARIKACDRFRIRFSDGMELDAILCDAGSINGTICAYGSEKGAMYYFANLAYYEVDGRLRIEVQGACKMILPAGNNAETLRIVSIVGMTYQSNNNELCNALKGSQSGERIVLSDVSPIEHTLEVRVSTKNLFPYVEPQTMTNGGLNARFNADGSILLSGSRSGTIEIPLETPLKADVPYTFSLNNSATGNVYLVLVSADGIEQTGISTYSQVDYVQTYTSIKDITLLRISSYGVLPAGGMVLKPQVEMGKSGTTYIQPIEYMSVVTVTVTGEDGSSQSYTANADGTVDGVTSVYPSMTLETNVAGASMDVTYNRDITAAIRNLEAALQGGA